MVVIFLHSLAIAFMHLGQLNGLTALYVVCGFVCKVHTWRFCNIMHCLAAWRRKYIRSPGTCMSKAKNALKTLCISMDQRRVFYHKYCDFLDYSYSYQPNLLLLATTTTAVEFCLLELHHTQAQ